MPVMMIMEWKGVTADQYEQVRRSVKWETDVPDGAIFHVASIGDGALHVTDIWRSPDDFNRFVQERLTAGVQQAGIQSQPDVKVYPVQAIFNPFPDKLK